MINVTIAQLPSTSAAAVVAQVSTGTTVADVLASKDVSSEGKTLKFNGVQVQGSTPLESDGMLTVTQGAKGNK